MKKIIYQINIKNVIFGIIILSRIKYSLQLTEETFKKITNNDSAALECFRNPTRVDICGSVTKYMSALNYGKNDKINTNYAINIINAIKVASWDISTLDFREGEINNDIFNVELPTQVKKIILSNIMPLKKAPNNIPDRFIQNLNSCPFESNDNIKVVNCSSRMNNLCSSKVSCVSSESNKNSNINSNGNTNTNTNGNSNIKSNNNINVNSGDNTITNTNDNTSMNTGTSNNFSNNTNPKNKNNSQGNNNNNSNNNNNNNNNDNNNSLGSSNVQVINTENEGPSNSKSLIKTFLFGLCTSVGILIVLLTILYIAQKYSKKNIVNFNKLSDYYENKPLVKNSKSSSSSYTDTASLNGTISSQTSYSNIMKHKRYLYVFDDGSVMMSKSLKNKNNDNNSHIASAFSSSGTNSVITNPMSQVNLNPNNSTLNVRSSIQSLNSRYSNVPTNSNLSISMECNPINITSTPSTDNQIKLETPEKALDKDSISIEIPK
ncbi:hypothetical protein H8356DRAFT_1359760 [Neocallimastix lanati (nom. inval.)]|jgi:hypothetical protein|nr:hypothetical protein H8356DRAFT_1359760 [Neocallimastix sp. JGI-2020a]